MDAFIPQNWNLIENNDNTNIYETFVNDFKNKILITYSCYTDKNWRVIYSHMLSNFTNQIQKEKNNMIETNIRLNFISGKTGCGFYFTATDKRSLEHHIEEDWPVMLRCFYIQTTDNTQHMFFELTTLCYNLNDQTIIEALDMFKKI